MSLAEHEEKFIKSFAAPHKKDRYLQLLASKKSRSKFLGYLDHSFEFDKIYALRINPTNHSPESIETELKEKGAPEDCFVISMRSSIDGRKMNLHEALTSVIGYGMGTILSCIPGKLAYYEAEDAGERYILSK